MKSEGGGCPKQWKPLDTGGTQPPTSDAVVNGVKELFPFKSTRNRYDKVFYFQVTGCQIIIVLV